MIYMKNGDILKKTEYFDCINVYIADQEAERKAILRELGYQA